jgi:lipopolysaccharide export system protein LptA
MKKTSKIILLVVAFGISFSFFAKDKKKESDLKTTVTSEHFSYNLSKGQAVYTGNVVVIDSEIDIITDKMTVFFAKKKPKDNLKDKAGVSDRKQGGDKAPPPLKPLGGIGGNVDRIVCEGHVIIVNKKDKATATGEKAIYMAATELVVVTGNAKLTNKLGILIGKVIEYNRRTGDLTASQATVINQGKPKKSLDPNGK